MVGVSIPDVSDWCEPLPQGQWSSFFGALAQRVQLVDVVHVKMSGIERYLNFARTFHPRKSLWKARAGFHPSLAMERTKVVERALQIHKGSYDAIMQIQTLCAPGLSQIHAPYLIYTDNTMALTQRLYRAWAPVSQTTATRWMSFEAAVCRRAMAVFTTSEFARRSIIDDYGCSPDDVMSVGTGANQMVEALGEKDYTAPHALFVGRDFTRKGGRVLLEAWPLVRERVPTAELTITGSPRSSSTDLPAGVRWIVWADRAALARLYQSASVFVLPSLFDPSPFVLREAMGYGLPCIGTFCCAIPEIINDGITGRLVSPSDPDSLATALVELLTDPVKTAAMGRAAHSKILEANRWIDVIDRITKHLADRGEP